MNDRRYRYRAIGLTFDSSIPLPELVPADGEPDVFIRYGAVPDRIEEALACGPWYQAAPGNFLLKVPRVGGYQVRDGRWVTVAPDPDATEDEVRVFLVASVMGALAHQRGFLPLHASAVAVGGHSVLFTGPSGAGKSTVAAAFHLRGHPLVADDLCAISLDADGRPMVYPGFRQLKLWADTLDHLGTSFGERRNLRPGMEKYGVLLAPNPAATALPIGRIFLITTVLSDTVKLIGIRGGARVEVLRKQTYRRRMMPGFGKMPQHFALCEALARRVPIVRVERPQDLRHVDRLVDRLEEDCRVGSAP